MIMAFPSDFVEQIKKIFAEESQSLLDSLSTISPVSIRHNYAKCCKPEVFHQIEMSVPWSSTGVYLDKRPSFTFDPLFHGGYYYVQEASSMFLEQALSTITSHNDSEDKSLKILDLCAAPGGKSTLTASVMPSGSLLVANEIIKSRAYILAENIIKWGNSDVIVTHNESSVFNRLGSFFDVVVADVPCSGEGMFRKDKRAIEEWSLANVKLCASRQREIISNIWESIKPGGFLVYSTCTFNLSENEDNVEWICQTLGAETINIPINDDWGITNSMKEDSDIYVYRFLPNKVKGEGFFLALIRKNISDSDVETGLTGSKKNQGKKKDMPKDIIPVEVKSLVSENDDFNFEIDGVGRVRALNKNHLEDYLKIKEHMNVIHAGITLGEMKKSVFIPDVSIALSDKLDLSKVKTCNLDLNQAISFLRGEAIVLPDNIDLGWLLVCYENKPLGWVKNIGNRANNSWPKEWKIRSENPYTEI
jgi:16S rRNA C967 or C1407 C5-methylase (RsmB/RsmF family)/NOL1/NOP2/fmu family ribosome biogenesis protein